MEGHDRSTMLVSEIVELADEYKKLSRQAVETAWRLGDKLIAARKAMSLREYLSLVNDKMPHGVRGVCAPRYARLRKDFEDASSAAAFESVTQALHSSAHGWRSYPRC